MENFVVKLLKFFSIFYFLFFFSQNIFSQSFNMSTYTQISWISFNSSTIDGVSTKYVVFCDMLSGVAKTGETVYYIAHSNEHGNAALVFDMDKSQIAQLRHIKNNGDWQLVFFTRTGTNNNNYRFVVDRIIPMKDVIGFAQNELPETVSYEDYYNAVASYIKTGNIDTEHIVSDKVNKAKNDAMLAEAMRSTEQEKQAEQQRQQETERREARDAYRTRMRILKNATVHGGYKPCFGSENTINLNINKIAVFGDIEDSYNNYSISSGNNPVMRDSGIHKIEIISDAASKSLLREVRRYNGLTNDLDSKTCIFFLSRSQSSEKYKLDDYILYNDIVSDAYFASQYDAKALDEWILQNLDK